MLKKLFSFFINWNHRRIISNEIRLTEESLGLFKNDSALASPHITIKKRKEVGDIEYLKYLKAFLPCTQPEFRRYPLTKEKCIEHPVTFNPIH